MVTLASGAISHWDGAISQRFYYARLFKFDQQIHGHSAKSNVGSEQRDRTQERTHAGREYFVITLYILLIHTMHHYGHSNNYKIICNNDIIICTNNIGTKQHVPNQILCKAADLNLRLVLAS